jgi:hypothetical protein
VHSNKSGQYDRKCPLSALFLADNARRVQPGTKGATQGRLDPTDPPSRQPGQLGESWPVLWVKGLLMCHFLL